MSKIEWDENKRQSNFAKHGFDFPDAEDVLFGENIKSYTVDEIRAMRARGESQTDFARIDAMTEAEIEAAADEEDAADGIEWDWESAELVIPQTKEHINLRIDADVVRFFKHQGKGYQTRMNAVLRSYMKAHQKKHPQA